jgi:hypothetical protein
LVSPIKAWANFDGTLSGTITPRGSYNLGSITKTATGKYTMALSITMADANYCPLASSGVYATNDYGGSANTGNITTTSYGVGTINTNLNTGTDFDCVSTVIFGN